VIDGQHRIEGLKSFNQEVAFDLNIVFFVGADLADEATVFGTVNLAQTKVNKSLVYDLFDLAEGRSPEKKCHSVVVVLDRIEGSPFFHKIKRLGVATPGRTGETLSQATVVGGLLPYVSSDPVADRDIGKRGGKWPSRAGDYKLIFREFFKKNEDESIVEVMINYFGAVKRRWPKAWESTRTGNILNRTNGYKGFMRFLRPAYRHYTTSSEIVSEDEFYELFRKVKIRDADFNRDNYLPGTSGATKLYNDLVAATNVATN